MPSDAAYMTPYMRQWRARNRERFLLMHRAQQAVRRAIKRGLLVRPDRCEKCDVECKPDAHHEDYTRPLDVEWLCKPCHRGV